MTSAPSDDGSRMRLPFEPSSASTARRLLGGLLSSRGVTRQVHEDALLVLHELVMNGLDHGRPGPDNQLLVFWAIEGDLLLVGVHDGGTDGVVAAQELTMDGVRGRGLAMVEALSESWVVRRNGGTEVSAWVRLAS